MEQSPQILPNSLYRPRSGEYVDYYVDILNKPPDRELDPDQKKKFIEFENGLMKGKCTQLGEGQLPIHVEGVELPLSEAVDNSKYSEHRGQLSLDYFLTDEGQKALIGLKIIEDPLLDKEELARTIMSKALQITDKKLKDLQKLSEEYVDNATIEAITEGKDIPTPERIVVFSNGTKLVERAKVLQAYKKFYKTIARIHNKNQNDADNLSAAQKAILQMYRKKINGLQATLEPDLLNYWYQIQAMENDNQKEVLSQTIKTIWPPLGRAKVEQGSVAMDSFIVRLDRIRNGVSLGEDGKYTAVSEDLERLFESDQSQPEIDSPPPIFSPEEMAILDNTVFDANQMQDFCKFLLERVGKLSSEPDETYSPDRPTRAKDGKWQVVVRPETGALGADDPPGALDIPANFSRTVTELIPPVGVIPGALHEIKHIFQDDNYRNNQRGLKLGNDMKGKGYVVLREAGAKDTERRVQKRMFGRDRPDSPHHLRAIKVLENGGSEIDAVMAFFDSYMQDNTDTSRKKAASAAVRGVKRTARREGGFDSQALDYAESSLIFNAAQNLDQKTRDVIFAEGAFSLNDLAELHRYGLLDTTAAEEFPLDKLIDLTVEYMRQNVIEMVDK